MSTSQPAWKNFDVRRIVSHIARCRKKFVMASSRRGGGRKEGQGRGQRERRKRKSKRSDAIIEWVNNMGKLVNPVKASQKGHVKQKTSTCSYRILVIHERVRFATPESSRCGRPQVKSTAAYYRRLLLLSSPNIYFHDHANPGRACLCQQAYIRLAYDVHRCFRVSESPRVMRVWIAYVYIRKIEKKRVGNT